MSYSTVLDCYYALTFGSGWLAMSWCIDEVLMAGLGESKAFVSWYVVEGFMFMSW
jgi:hypothetical protein